VKVKPGGGVGELSFDEAIRGREAGELSFDEAIRGREAGGGGTYVTLMKGFCGDGA